MDNTSKWTYRKKKDRIVIECDRKYKAVLPKDAKDAYNALIWYASLDNQTRASFLSKAEKEKKPETFAYELLNEPVNKDAKKKITEEELKKLWDITK